MTLIGVYAVEFSELTKPPALREYIQLGVYDQETRSWSEDTDSRLRFLFPESEDEYSVGEIKDELETTTTHVYREEEVPGTVKRTTA